MHGSLARLLPVTLLIVIFGCTQSQKAASTSVAQKIPAEQAQKLFTELCAACHGKQARGGVGPDLTVSHYKYGKDAPTIQKTILDGRPGGMPAFGSFLKPGEAAALADYLRSLQ